MAKYVPTAEQRAAFNADHSTRETAKSVVHLISAGKLIRRALVRCYVSHDVDTTGPCDTVGVFLVDLTLADKTVSGYATFAFNVVNGIPIAAEFRDFTATITA